jgi:signal peptidase I
MLSNSNPEDSSPPPRRSLLSRWYVRAPIEVAAILILWYFVIQVRPTSGASMLPALADGAHVFVDKLSYRFREPARGDVIIFRSNEEPPMLFCKRAIGLPKEIIEIRSGQVYINEVPLYEPYIISSTFWELPPTRIGEQQVYAIGDNRGMAMVSHFQGLVAYRNILGRLIGEGREYQ